MDLYNNINVTTKEFTKKCNLIVFCNIINNAKVLKKTKKICRFLFCSAVYCEQDSAYMCPPGNQLKSCCQ